MLSDLAYLADGAYGALVSGVILGTVERALLVHGTAVDGGVTGRTDLKFGELVIFDLYCVVRIALALYFYPPSLFDTVSHVVMKLESESRSNLHSPRFCWHRRWPRYGSQSSMPSCNSCSSTLNS